MRSQQEIIDTLLPIDVFATELPERNVFLGVCAALTWALGDEAPPQCQERYRAILTHIPELVTQFNREIAKIHATERN